MKMNDLKKLSQKIKNSVIVREKKNESINKYNFILIQEQKNHKKYIYHKK